ncbi:3'-5' exonuclease [Beggiatoa leptomitoformis]|uniref:3'-5' exonuclease n=1 Tax=Beggiatoa leptomitoformis TaxID=288004 RepID=A0A2N9YHZ6_9GAMM|nr:3'-5' exonuclease [Beggiatoa leptomitoformis]ALG67743.1 3'-5' exonuclease [Beggiatoa leptomitoformis]AUI70015.1 3'-5' exonuclease [Beggiatoa leptomitoformis]
MNIFVFDIETIPDVASGRRLYGTPAEMAQLSDKDVAKVMFHYRKQETDGQTEVLRHHLQKIIAISVVLRIKNDRHDIFKVWSLGEPNAPEEELIQRFYTGLQEYTPTLVSWNGSGFDLPVLHYRTLLHGIPAPRYWETNGDFRWNNYLSRFHERHTDLMDVLAAYQPKAFARLDEIATILGFPGKMGMSGDQVWDVYQAGGIQDIRHYCETDVLNTYLIFLRFELIRGKLKPDEYQKETQRVRETLGADAQKKHLQEFLTAWEG